MSYNDLHHRRSSRRKNRRWSETQNTWAVPTRVAGLIALLAVVGILYAALNHSRNALWDEIAKAEQIQRSLDEDLYRETFAWDKMRSQRNVIATLRNNGIAMGETPRARRIAMGGFTLPAGVRGPDRGSTAYAANL